MSRSQQAKCDHPPDVWTLRATQAGFALRLRKAFPGASVVVTIEGGESGPTGFFATVEAGGACVSARWGLEGEPDLGTLWRQLVSQKGLSSAAE